MKAQNPTHPSPLTRRQTMALLSAFGVSGDAMAQDALAANPRAFRVVLENDRVRVLEYRSGPGLGVCGQGMHFHPARVSIALTGAKLKVTGADGSVDVKDVPPGHVFYAEAQQHATEVIGGGGTRTYIVELKGPDWKPSTG